MLNPNWSSEDCQIDDIDPGKDIFALLFLSFFLINAVILICITKPGEQTVRVNAVYGSGNKVLETSYVAGISIKNGKTCISQNNTDYLVPEELDRFLKQGKFETATDEKGNTYPSLIIQNPGKELTAGDMINIVNLFNKAKVGVDFRTINSGK